MGLLRGAAGAVRMATAGGAARGGAALRGESRGRRAARGVMSVVPAGVRSRVRAAAPMGEVGRVVRAGGAPLSGMERPRGHALLFRCAAFDWRADARMLALPAGRVPDAPREDGRAAVGGAVGVLLGVPVLAKGAERIKLQIRARWVSDRRAAAFDEPPGIGRKMPFHGKVAWQKIGCLPLGRRCAVAIRHGQQHIQRADRPALAADLLQNGQRQVREQRVQVLQAVRHGMQRG